VNPSSSAEHPSHRFALRPPAQQAKYQLRTILNCGRRWERWSREREDEYRAVKHDHQLLTLFLAHRGALVTYARGILRDHAHAEDVVQEAYLRLTDAAGPRAIEEPQGYLYRIVRNLAVDGRRRARPEADETQLSAIAADRPSPEAEALHRDQLRVVNAALAELPERGRIALEMHRLQGCKLREIADHLGISITQTHTLIVDAVEHCKKRLRQPKKHRSRSSYGHDES
jgi:RNA polymerase sigma-70 factor (ECF subfamily)